MKKTKEELNTLRQEYKTLVVKLNELSEDELKIVTAGCPCGFQVGLVNIIEDEVVPETSEELVKQNEVNPMRPLEGKVLGLNIEAD